MIMIVNSALEVGYPFGFCVDSNSEGIGGAFAAYTAEGSKADKAGLAAGNPKYTQIYIHIGIYL